MDSVMTVRMKLQMCSKKYVSGMNVSFLSIWWAALRAPLVSSVDGS